MEQTFFEVQHFIPNYTSYQIFILLGFFFIIQLFIHFLFHRAVFLKSILDIFIMNTQFIILFIFLMKKI